MMEKVVKSLPVTFIKFDNGAEKEAKIFLRELYDMIDSDYTEFYLNDLVDVAFYELVKEKCKNGIREIIELSDIAYVYWNYSNEMEINLLYDEMCSLIYD